MLSEKERFEDQQISFRIARWHCLILRSEARALVVAEILRKFGLINHRSDPKALVARNSGESLLSKLHQHNPELVGRADNRTVWNLANLRVGFPLANIF